MKIMASSTSNEEELLSDKLEKVADEYNGDAWDEERQALLQVLQNNDCREVIARCVDGDVLTDAFVFSAALNHPDILRAFLDQGISVDGKNQYCNTALIASNDGSREIVKLLLDHNADIHLRNNDGKTALDLAQTEEIKEMIQNHVNTSYVLK